MRGRGEGGRKENQTCRQLVIIRDGHLQEDCDKYYEKALENLTACGYKKVDFDALSKEEEHFWRSIS
ncbi:hypothetical protein, partial [Faecalibacterium hattorii]|uniref:hypothetical protein n=1 Tax=Faecalibacterium hattorii TaxID=2935520 RepID=UPI003AAA487F